MTAKPPKGLADGVYWARLKTVSTNLTPAVGETQQDKITAQIKFRFEQVTGVFYKSGSAVTGLNITEIRNEISDDNLSVYADFTRSGNSPYLGSMILKIFDKSDKMVHEEVIFISIYFDGTRRIETDISALSAGEYKAELSFITVRSDIPNENLVHAEPTSQTFRFKN